MKKSQMKIGAKKHLLRQIETAIDYAHSDDLKFKREVVWNQCQNIFGAILAYWSVGLLNDSEYHLYFNITSNISLYYNVFGKGV